MKRARFEIEVSTLKDGRLYLKMYDEYWDGIKTAFVDTSTTPPTITSRDNCAGCFKHIIDRLSNLQPGRWYMLITNDYPFGAITAIEEIPGRHLRWNRSTPAR